MTQRQCAKLLKTTQQAVSKNCSKAYKNIAKVLNKEADPFKSLYGEQSWYFHIYKDGKMILDIPDHVLKSIQAKIGCRPKRFKGDGRHKILTANQLKAVRRKEKPFAKVYPKRDNKGYININGKRCRL